MTPADLSIIVLVGLFLLALVPRAHMGLAAFTGSLIVALYAGISTDQLVSYFPSNFVILIVGVMCLFGILQVTGAMDWFLRGATRAVGNRRVLIPVVPFVLGAVIAGVGTLPLAACAIVAPIGMALARQHRIPAFLMAFVVMNGVLSGLFSPVAVFGLTANKQLADLGVPLPMHSSLVIFLASVAVGLLLTVALMVVYRRQLRSTEVTSSESPLSGPTAGIVTQGPVSRKLSPFTKEMGPHTSAAPTAGIATQVYSEAPETMSGTEHSKPAKILSIIAFAVLVVAGVGFRLDLGYTAFVLAFVLILVLRLEPTQIIAKVPWGVVVLIGGLLTYVGLMQELGAFERLSEMLSVDNSPALSLLVLCYIAALTSFLANSIAVIVTTLPLLPPLIAAGVDPLGAVIALLFSAVLVDNNPVGSAGGLVIGATAAEDRQRLFRRMLGYGLGAVVLAPAAMWAIFGLW
ncbi:SLC13 family permease [Arthrobacter mobilis]|uniref:Citrate transporter-like domain-containing protein n=1 Tax=Arthrobacter mobilis TaxID=2724944 RepID=A0A7X6K5U9_9MICC|nr:SLC13 family permease [Arthrobacter mobilis]NKX54744.1 hypothetical protein [Arthrobacter mobilis]